MTPLEEMDLSVRTFNCLRRAGINTVEGLTDMTREQFRSTLGLGSNCMNETEERMDEMGLSFREETAVQKQYMSDSAQYAYTVHAQIILGAQMVENGLYQMAKGFKIMRDEKLYKDMGYNSFEAYCETETGMSRKQVYQYIAVVEKIPEKEFVTPGLQNAGIKKLYMLTTLNEEQREEIVQSADLESTTVKELKAKIDELTGAVQREKELKEQWHEQAKTEADRSIETAERLNKELADRDDEVAMLMQKLKELESRPIEVQAVNVEDTKEYQELYEQRKITRQALLDTCKERNELRDRLRDLEKKMSDPLDGMKIYAVRMSEKQYNNFLKDTKDSNAELFKVLGKAVRI